MNTKLSSRLEELDINEKLINDQVLLGNVSTIIAYASSIEGLGTKDSDIDVYALVEEFPDFVYDYDYEHYKVKIVAINDVLLDVEYWKIDFVDKLIAQLSLKDVDIKSEQIKFLNRLKIGAVIYGDEYYNELSSRIDGNLIKAHTIKNYTILAYSEFEDAINLLNSSEYLCALSCSRDALQYSIAALNALNDVINLKKKWISKIFVDNKGFGNIFFEDYMNVMYSTINSENIASYLEDLLELIQNILSSSSVFIKEM